jgi:hypothetical protein
MAAAVETSASIESADDIYNAEIENDLRSQRLCAGRGDCGVAHDVLQTLDYRVVKLAIVVGVARDQSPYVFEPVMSDP